MAPPPGNLHGTCDCCLIKLLSHQAGLQIWPPNPVDFKSQFTIQKLRNDGAYIAHEEAHATPVKKLMLPSNEFFLLK